MSIEDIYKESGALLEGHFILSSGNHSNRYLQSAKVLEDPKRASKLADSLADMIRKSGIEIDTVCAPALGGVIAGYELARSLDTRSIFVERKAGQMELRRGFEVAKGERVLICEDIITTGGSAMEAATIIEELGAKVVAFASLANRGFCLYTPDSCPMCAEGSQAIKPGSRS